MPKTSPLWLSAALLAFLSVSSLADSITLKSGDKVEGRIVSETETEVVIEEKISATITDQRAIPKADVAKIDKDDPSIAAWEALKNYKPGANSLPAASYLPVIGALTNFATTHTASPHAEEAKKAAAEFQEEQKRVEAGDVKLAGKWLTAEEAEKERYQINGLIAFNYMKDQAARRDWLGALNSFSVLEKNFRGSRSYPDGVETARKVLEALKGDVERQKQTLAAQKKEREQGMKLANAAQKAEMADVQKKEAAAADAAMATAQKQGLKWPPLIPRSEKSVAAIAAKIPTEQQALTRVDTAKLRQSIQAAEKAQAALAEQKLADAEKLVKEATSLWAENELAKRLSPEITAAKQDFAKAETAAAAQAKATAAAPARVETAPAAPAATKPVRREEPEPETPFLMTPAGAIVVVVLIALITAAVTAYRKIKSRANDVLE